MVAVPCISTAPVPPPAYHRAQAKVSCALQIDALTLVTRLHLLVLCRLAVRLAHRRCPPPLPAGPGGHPRVYHEASLLLVALLRTLWRLSYQDLHDWLVDWPALARACGLPQDAQGRVRVPSAAQQCKRSQQAGAPIYETIFVILVHRARYIRLVSGRDVIVDSAPILAWRRTDPDAAVGHAPHHHPRPLLRGYRVHTLLCRGSGLPLLFLLSPANVHDAPFARPLLDLARRLYGLHPRVVRLDAGYWGLRLIAWIHTALGAVAVVPWNPKRQKNCSCACRRPGPPRNWANAAASNASLAASSRCSALPLAAATARRLDGGRDARRPDLCRDPGRRPRGAAGWPARSHSLAHSGARTYLGGPAPMS